ncbi:natriuretic peptide A-like isoform X1 [Cololabis saira]|uniref:natriuretic peptide A-like isoform X1 n=1 Tax=Cololabis saira TaxID=129043 RepID=UPI002AD45196|nr:natriuretic peptide A-like isoform X1 [Cololabis saira]
MKTYMNLSVCLSLLLLLHSGGTKPVSDSDLQALQQLLEDDITTVNLLPTVDQDGQEDQQGYFLQDTPVFRAAHLPELPESPESQPWTSYNPPSSGLTSYDPPRAGLDPPRSGLETKRESWTSYDPPRSGLDPPRSGLGTKRESWTSYDPPRSGLGSKRDPLSRFLQDFLTSKRSWSRYKKGGLRSCFRVRLERIGSFSGLGC